MPRVSGHRPSKKIIDALTYDLPGKYNRLNKTADAPLKLTYSFDPAAIASLKLGYSGWSPFSAAQKDAARLVLAEYETFINVRFVEKGAGGDLDLYFGRTNLGKFDGFGGIKWKKTATKFDLDGYAMFDTSVSLTGSWGRHLLVHEIGHAMTLKHPGHYGGEDEGPFLPKRIENNKYSVMSYKDNPDSRDVADHLMLYDIAALQARFGANLTYRTGDDVYTAPVGRLQVLWDAGGFDTIDGGSRTTDLVIDLRDGHFSSLGQKANLAIAYGAVIEQAKGGSGNDKLTGNAWANTISAGPGNDRIDGGKGPDVLSGGPGADAFLFTTAPGNSRDTILDFEPGLDTIRLDRDAFAGLGKTGVLAAGKFAVGSAAGDKGDRIIYDDQTGQLIHDRNGSGHGKAKVIAVVDAGLDIDAGTFIVV